MILAFDPGARYFAWAAIDNEAEGARMTACGLCRAVDPGWWALWPPWPPSPSFDRMTVAIEVPQIYQRRRTKKDVDPNDLIDVAVTVGRVAEWATTHGAAEIRLVRPRIWKGTVPGDVMVARIEAALDPGERELVGRIAPKSMRHNVLDAAGLGFWVAGRPLNRRTEK